MALVVTDTDRGHLIMEVLIAGAIRFTLPRGRIIENFAVIE